MRITPLLTLALLLAAALSGCSQTTTTQSSNPSPTPEQLVTVPGFTPLAKMDAPRFSAPILIDNVRAGGEPVIAVTPKGTILVSSHPGFTHYHPSEPTHIPVEVLRNYAGQVYLFRSTDNGTTWAPVGASGGTGPRSAGLGVSDPDFTVMADGSICYTDLEGLAAASTSCSTDDGVTWLKGGNPLSSGKPVDRQWLASYKDELYFTANDFGAGANFRVSTDKGLTWTDRGSTACAGDLIANPANGHIYQSCNGSGLSVSTDGGATWGDPSGPEGADGGGARNMNEPALDGAGNVWITWSDGERSLHVAGTPDEGKTWPWDIDLTPHFALVSRSLGICSQTEATQGNQTCQDEYADPMFGGPMTNGTYVWPWVSAGSAGRIAVSWIGSFDTVPSDSYKGAWFVFTAFVVNATSDAPTVVVSQLTPAPIHIGPICQQGTQCQVDSMQGDAAGDRRLGDFFETTVEPGTGQLLGVWSNTHEYPSDVVGHVQFVRQVGGVSLIAPGESAKPTQG